MAKVKDTMDLLKSLMEQLMKDKMVKPKTPTLGLDVRVIRPYQNIGNHHDTQKLEMLIFYKDDPIGWVCKVEHYFQVNRVPEWETILAMTICIEGASSATHNLASTQSAERIQAFTCEDEYFSDSLSSTDKINKNINFYITSIMAWHCISSKLQVLNMNNCNAYGTFNTIIKLYIQ